MDLTLASTFLFVPGDRPERFGRALRSGADVVIVDLEDGVAPARREEAREHVRAFLRAGHQAAVRISAPGTEDHRLDIAALRRLARAVVLSKSESADDVAGVAASFDTPVEIIALVETARGITAVTELAASAARLAFGNIDLARDIGVGPDDRHALQHARSQLVMASTAAGLVGPIDGVTTSIGDADAVRTDARYGASLGFRGKLCIHPAQIPPARAGLMPDEHELAWAESVLAVAAEGQARVVGGSMVDRPVEERARDVLRRVARAATAHP